MYVYFTDTHTHCIEAKRIYIYKPLTMIRENVEGGGRKNFEEDVEGRSMLES
jgi:hypothetical protein